MSLVGQLRDALQPHGGGAGERVRPMQHVGWHARLALEFDRRGDTTRLASRRHIGPLLVQRPLYPEGRSVCHAIVVHPPGGIAGGDFVELDVHAQAHAHALLTTPGAGKLYKSAGRIASQQVRLRAEPRACLEWLPQETIVFDAADASIGLDIEVGDGALAFAWEIATLGREAMDERFSSGRLRNRVSVRIEGRLVLYETAEVVGGSRWLASPAGWRGCRCSGTFVVAGRGIDDALLETCRETIATSGECGVSRLEPNLLVARYLGPTAGAARDIFAALWARLRPALAGVEARRPRIWST